MQHPSLNRILKQIEEHRGELGEPEGPAKALAKEDGGPSNLGEPMVNVREVFTEDALDQRKKELELADQESEELQAVHDQDGKKIHETLEAGGSYADIEPPEPPEDLPEEVQEYLESDKEEYSFHSCYDLRDFFKSNREAFEEWSHPAVDSVLAAVDSITTGCKCKVEHRRKMVEEYYVKFISQNQHTSLIDTIKEILKTKKVKFYSDENLFLEK